MGADVLCTCDVWRRRNRFVQHRSTLGGPGITSTAWIAGERWHVDCIWYVVRPVIWATQNGRLTTDGDRRWKRRFLTTDWVSMFGASVNVWFTNQLFIPNMDGYMRKLAYKLQGGDVPAHLKGTVIYIKIAETVAEQTQLAGGNEALGVAKFADGYAISAQGILRRRSGKVDKDGKHVETPETLQAFADGFVLAERAEGTPRETKPETKVKNSAAAAGNAMFEKALGDEDFYKRGVKFGFIDETAFAEWKANREAAKAAAPAEATK